MVSENAVVLLAILVLNLNNTQATSESREQREYTCVTLLLRGPRELCAKCPLNLGNDGIVRDGLSTLVLVNDLRLHVHLLRKRLLGEALGLTRLLDG